MALLANLGDFHHSFPNAQTRPHRQVPQVDANRIDIFREYAGRQGNGAPHGVHAFLRQQGDLAVPVAGMGIPHNAMAQP